VCGVHRFTDQHLNLHTAATHELTKNNNHYRTDQARNTSNCYKMYSDKM